MKNYHEYLIQVEKIYDIILEYIEDDDSNSCDLQEFRIKEIKSFNFLDNQDVFRSFLYLISYISKNIHKRTSFSPKIFKLLENFLDEIMQIFPNTSLFHIFKRNKKILLFLVQKQIISIDKDIVDLMFAEETLFFKYRYYFYPEIKSIVNERTKISIEKELVDQDEDIFDNFEEKRQIGENDSYICQIIRKDSIDEFVIYVNRLNIPIKTTKIKKSIFETNSYLCKRDPTLIEYAAFFGSIQIFNYLRLNDVTLTASLWIYAIHGKNADIIHILEENGVNPPENSYLKCFKEAIKCHHNNIANYIQSNFDFNECENFNENSISYCFHYHNFEFFPNELTNEYIIFYACKYDYLEIVKFLLKDEDFDINTTVDIYDKI